MTALLAFVAVDGMLTLFSVPVLATIGLPTLAHESWISKKRLTDQLSGNWCCNHRSLLVISGASASIIAGPSIRPAFLEIPLRTVGTAL